LRGRSSNADEHLVVRTARKLHLRAVVERADIRDVALRQNLSLEMAARQVRHEFLARTAVRLGIKSVLLGHHADDQLELFFLRLFRGAGSEGLAGMKWIAPTPAKLHIAASTGSRPLSRPLLIRPLLGIARKDLAGWVRENKIPFREDATNAALDIQRNRIRHELLPLLRRRYQPALDRTISRLMEIAAAESEFVTATASGWLKAKRRSSFPNLPAAVQRRCIQLQLLDLDLAPDFELVENLRTVPGRRIMVSPTLALRLGSDGRLERTILSQAPGNPGSSSGFRPLKPVILDLSPGRGLIRFGGLAVQWQIQASKTTYARKGRAALRAAFSGTEYFDAAALGSRLILRHWQPGDRFQPIGMRSAVKLQDIFVNEKIPRSERHKLVILARDDGELVWVEKLRISERFKLTSLTNRRLLWKWARI
jgi:tRNA(Ile)-lysidine synthase